MEYYWSNNTLNRKIEKLKKLYNETKSVSEKGNIMNQINYINNFRRYFNTYYKQPKLIDAYIEIKKYIESEVFAKKYLEDFNKSIQGNYDFITPEKLKLENDEIVESMYEFYKNMPKDIFEKFLKNYEARKTHMKFELSGTYDVAFGYTILMPSLKENYLSIQKCDNVTDIFTAIHEMGHAVFSDLNKDSKFTLNGYRDEIFPETLEIICGDFFSKYYGDDPKKIVTASHGMRILSSNIWDNFTNLLQIEKEYGHFFRSSKDLINASSVAGISSNELSSICNLETFPEMHEQLSYIFAIELYYLYKSDPEKFEDIIIKLANFNSEDGIETIDYLISLGIIPNEHSKEFHSEMQNESKKLIKKYE